MTTDPAVIEKAVDDIASGNITRGNRGTSPMTTVVVPVARLQTMLDRVAPAAATTSSLAVLLMIRLSVENGLQAQATDGYWGVTAQVPADCNGYFDVLVPARKLHQLVQTFNPSSYVTFSTSVNDLVVACDRSKTTFRTADAEDFPRFPESSDPLVAFPGERLKLASDLTVWAASRQDSRPVLKNVKIAVGDEGVTLEAGDGFGVATWAGFADDPGVELFNSSEFMVQARVLFEMGKIGRANPKGRMTLSAAGNDPSNPNHVVLDASTEGMALRVAARCNEGQFPDMMKMVTQVHEQGSEMDTAARATFKPADVLTSLRRVLLLASELPQPGRLPDRERGDGQPDHRPERGHLPQQDPGRGGRRGLGAVR